MWHLWVGSHWSLMNRMIFPINDSLDNNDKGLPTWDFSPSSGTISDSINVPGVSGSFRSYQVTFLLAVATDHWPFDDFQQCHQDEPGMNDLHVELKTLRHQMAKLMNVECNVKPNHLPKSHSKQGGGWQISLRMWIILSMLRVRLLLMRSGSWVPSYYVHAMDEQHTGYLPKRACPYIQAHGPLL